MPIVLLTWGTGYGIFFGKNHMVMLQCNYNIISVETIQDIDNILQMFVVNLYKPYTGSLQ